MTVIKGCLDTTDVDYVDMAVLLAVPYSFSLGIMAFGSKILGGVDETLKRRRLSITLHNPGNLA